MSKGSQCFEAAIQGCAVLPGPCDRRRLSPPLVPGSCLLAVSKGSYYGLKQGSVGHGRSRECHFQGIDTRSDFGARRPGFKVPGWEGDGSTLGGDETAGASTTWLCIAVRCRGRALTCCRTFL